MSRIGARSTASSPCCSTQRPNGAARPAARVLRVLRRASTAPAVLVGCRGVGGVPRGRRVRARASGEAEGADPAAVDLSPQQAMELLGVGANASFEDIVRAKNRLVDATDDMETVIRVRHSPAHVPS